MKHSFYESQMTILEEYGVPVNNLAAYSSDISIRTGDSPGPTIMSNDPEKSHVKAHTITVESISEMKRIGGIPDRAFEEGNMNSDLPTPAVYLECQMEGAGPYNPKICTAYQAYVFGESKRVASYEEPINDLRFPVTMSVFTGEDIVVTAGNPLIIRDEEGHGDPVALVYNTIIVEPGGQIIWEATGRLTAKVMTFLDAEEGTSLNSLLAENGTEQNFISKGADGEDGDDGGKGDDGGDGGNGNAGKNNKNSCARAATKGANGTDGVEGTDGSNGSNGGPGNNVNNTFDELNGTVNVGSGGGNGGTGGKGGNGGKGGKGGNGGASTSECSAGNGGNGGDGGNGGLGGNAGKGGNGQDVFITYSSGSPNFILKQATGSAGTAGVGGTGGAPGNGGTGSTNGDNGNQGNKGANGTDAEPGVPGKVYINGEILS